MKKKKFKAVELNKLDDETITNIRLWRNSSFVREKMYNKNEITEEEHKKYINSVKNDPNRGIFVFYLDDIPFGVYQYTINTNNNCITGGHYLIDEDFQYMGYGVIMAYFISVIDFDFFKCNKNYGEVISNNKRLIELNKKMRVPLEGILRQQIMVEGQYLDIYCYGVLRNEWDYGREAEEKRISRIVDTNYEIII